jgi:hypothetical protein
MFLARFTPAVNAANHCAGLLICSPTGETMDGMMQGTIDTALYEQT